MVEWVREKREDTDRNSEDKHTFEELRNEWLVVGGGWEVDAG